MLFSECVWCSPSSKLLLEWYSQLFLIPKHPQGPFFSPHITHRIDVCLLPGSELLPARWLSNWHSHSRPSTEVCWKNEWINGCLLLPPDCTLLKAEAVPYLSLWFTSQVHILRTLAKFTEDGSFVSVNTQILAISIHWFNKYLFAHLLNQVLG